MTKSILKKVYRKVGEVKFFRRVIPIGNFVEIRREDVGKGLFDSWKDPSVPKIQFETCTKRELGNYRKGLPVEPFDALINILKDNVVNLDKKKILEVGCASGYYSEVLKIKGIKSKYSGCDYSESFIEFAKKLFPGINFQVQDARSLFYSDNSFDIVISGCCLLHIMEYEKAIAESARVAKEYVVFHRTPILHKKETSYYLKTAYGVKMFEIHFNERELLKLMGKYGLKVVDIITFNTSFEEGIGDFYAYKTYLCRKD